VNGGYHDLDGCRAIDPTHPGTRQRLAYAIAKFKACGFEMIKIDFIGHAAIEADSYYDTSVKTGMQAFRKGMEYLVDQLDDQMVVYVAISPNLGTNRYTHMRRIACDAYSAIGETQYTLNSTTNGWWQTHVYDYIDGDHLVLGTQSLGANRARVASGVITGTMITGDDFSVSGQWSTRAQTLYQNQNILDIARNGKAFMPIEGNSGNQASELFGRQIGNYFYLAVFNYGSTTKSYNIPLSRIGLSGTLNATELFSNNVVTANGTLSVSLPAADAAIYRFSTGSSLRMRSETAAEETLYPNPASSVVHVHYAELIDVKAIAMNSGAVNKISFQRTGPDDLNIVAISGLSSGIYILTLTNAKGQSKNFRLVRK
jgi:alpha-galactosidase